MIDDSSSGGISLLFLLPEFFVLCTDLKRDLMTFNSENSDLFIPDQLPDCDDHVSDLVVYLFT